MKVQNHPSAWGVLAGMLVLLLAVVANISCGGAPRAKHTIQKHHDPRAVAVTVACVAEGGLFIANGSGVVLDERRVLSANHATDWCPFPIVMIKTEGGREYQMRIARRWSDRDVVLLELLSPTERFADVKPLPVARPSGELCASTAFPSRVAPCGKFKRAYDTRCPLARNSKTLRWCHNFAFDTVVAGGNSGSAIYDEKQNLVGLVTGGSSEEALGSELYSIRGEFR